MDANSTFVVFSFACCPELQDDGIASDVDDRKQSPEETNTTRVTEIKE